MRLLGEEIDGKANVHFSLKRYPVWWVILLVTMGFDIFTTWAFIAKFGIAAEGNLFTRVWMSTVGPLGGNVIGKLLQLVAVVCFVGLHRRLGNLFLLIIILINCWAIVINSMSLVM